MNRYALIAAGLISVVFLSYILNFYVHLGYAISDNPETWGQLGDYAGGILNPLLSFISLVLLIKSLSLQNQANHDLREEIRNTRKSEKLRSFEAQLFHMIDSQRSLFESLKVKDPLNKPDKTGADAVIFIEEEVYKIREKYGHNDESNKAITKYLEILDESDKIFNITRIFYNMVKLISEKLSGDNGFSQDDRRSHYITLINFTDFALIRLIMLSAQFMDYQSVRYLKESQEFSSVVADLSLGYNLY